MNNLPELSCHCMTPIKTNFVNVEAYKYLRINIYAVNTIELLVIFSDDGIRECTVSKVFVFQDQWLAHRITVCNKFVKFITLTNRCFNFDENMVDLKTDGYLIKKFQIEQPKQSSTQGIMRKIRTSYQSNRNSPTNSPKIPELVFKNQLLMGGPYNNIACLPKGSFGEVLTYDLTGQILWVPFNQLLNDLKLEDPPYKK